MCLETSSESAKRDVIEIVAQGRRLSVFHDAIA
jgi:hypothetical protein